MNIADPLPKRVRRMPSLWTVVSYWIPRGVFDINPLEPGCFACGLEDAPECMYEVSDAPRERWLKVGGYLQRAHLVDHRKGGLDAPQNLVMLCDMCHRMMPSFTDGQAAIDWVLAGPALLNFVKREYARQWRRLPQAQEAMFPAA